MESIEQDEGKRKWVCPDCGDEEPRNWNAKTRPFCDKCEWRDAVLIEKVPRGPGKEKFAEFGGDL